MQKPGRFPVLISAFLVLLILGRSGWFVWTHWYNPCDVEAVQDASALLESQLESFDGTSQVATSASRTSLIYPVTILQQILMNTRELPVPACMQTAKKELMDYMDTVIRAFLAYGAGDADGTIRALLHQSDAHYDNFTAELAMVKECAPFCMP